MEGASATLQRPHAVDTVLEDNVPYAKRLGKDVSHRADERAG